MPKKKPEEKRTNSEKTYQYHVPNSYKSECYIYTHLMPVMMAHLLCVCFFAAASVAAAILTVAAAAAAAVAAAVVFIVVVRCQCVYMWTTITELTQNERVLESSLKSATHTTKHSAIG